jgi:hypothetical protein
MGRYATTIGVGNHGSDVGSEANSNQSPTRDVADREQEQRETARWLVVAAQRGEAVDPNNAHFAILEAAGWNCLGEERRARRALLNAADKRDFHEYTPEVADLLTRPLRGKLFSGNYAILQAEASILLPFYAHYKYLTRVFAHWGNLKERTEARIKMLKLADTVSRKSDVLIAMLVAASCAKICVVPESVVPDTFSSISPEKFTDAEYLDWARQLQARALTEHVDVVGFDPAASTRSQLAIIRAARKYGHDQAPYFPPDFPISTLFGLEWSGALLASLILVFPAAGLFMVGQRLRQSDPWAAALPLLPPLFAIGALAEWLGDLWSAALAILLILGLISAFVPRYRPALRYLLWGAILVGGVSGIATRGASLACFAAVILAVTWGFSQVQNAEWSAWLVSIVQVLGVTAWTAVLLVVANGWGTQLRHLLVPLGILLLCAAFGTRRRLPIFAMVGPTLLVGAIAYGFAVRGVVALDRESLAVLDASKNEVSEVRHLAQGILEQ